MFTDNPRLVAILDRELIGFVTAVNADGRPQTSPVWYVRDGDDLVVYNRPTSPRLRSVAANPQVAFNLRGDLRARGALLVEGVAAIEDLPPAKGFSGYIEKYGREIERLGWSPESFSDDFSVGLRISVTRVRSWGLDVLDK